MIAERSENGSWEFQEKEFLGMRHGLDIFKSS